MIVMSGIPFSKIGADHQRKLRYRARQAKARNRMPECPRLETSVVCLQQASRLRPAHGAYHQSRSLWFKRGDRFSLHALQSKACSRIAGSGLSLIRSQRDEKSAGRIAAFRRSGLRYAARLFPGTFRTSACCASRNGRRRRRGARRCCPLRSAACHCQPVGHHRR